MDIGSLLNFTISFLPFIALIYHSTAVTFADPLTTWVPMREDDVIMGSKQTWRLTLFNHTAISCARTCSRLDWCSVFVTNDMERKCELLESQRLSLNFSSRDDKTFLYRELDSSKENPEDWCPVDAGFVLSPAAQFCFIVVDNINATWLDSRDECRRRGLELAVPDTTLKMKVLLRFLSRTSGSQEIFIGAFRSVSNLYGRWNGSFVFKWITGTSVDPEFLTPFWGKDEPNNVGSKQHCLTISKKLGSLINDFECNARSPFVCEKHRNALN